MKRFDLQVLFDWLLANNTKSIIIKGGCTVIGLLLVQKAVEVARFYRMIYAIPAISFSGTKILPFLTTFGYGDAIQSLANVRMFLQTGYEKYPNSAFRVPWLHRWLIVVNGQDMIRDLRNGKEDEISFSEAVAETLQIKYTIGPEILQDHYHIGVIRSSVTRNIGCKLSECVDEIRQAIDAYIPLPPPSSVQRDHDGGWVKITVLPTFKKVISRASNRYFLGLPLCRSEEYNDLCVQFSINAAFVARKINLWPDFMKPIVGPFFSILESIIQEVMKHLGPTFQQRIDMFESDGNEKNMPNDLFTWLIASAPPERRTNIRDLSTRILLINFAAMNTSSNALGNAIFYLAGLSMTSPEAIEILREEVKSALGANEPGREVEWSKEAVMKMIRLDSFLKEAQRITGPDNGGVLRKVLKDFTFSNGTVVPKGSIIGLPVYALHHEQAYYEDPHLFKPFRFVEEEDIRRMKEDPQDDYSGLRKGIVTPSNIWFGFGQGRDACPGRFFAASMIKTILAYLLLNYDLKFERPEEFPPKNEQVSLFVIPSYKQEILLRKR